MINVSHVAIALTNFLNGRSLLNLDTHPKQEFCFLYEQVTNPFHHTRYNNLGHFCLSKRRWMERELWMLRICTLLNSFYFFIFYLFFIFLFIIRSVSHFSTLTLIVISLWEQKMGLSRHGKTGQNFLARLKKYLTRTRFFLPEGKVG